MRKDQRTERGSIPYDLGDYVGTSAKGYRRSDARILEDVQVELARLAGIDSTDVDVSVTEGTVILTGSVESRHDLRTVVACAENVAGVIDVRSHLRVGERPDAFKGGISSLPRDMGFDPPDVA